MLFVDRFMKKLNILKAHGSLIFMIDNIVGLLCLFYFNLRVNSKLLDNTDTTEWMTIGAPIYAFTGISFLFMLQMLIIQQKIKKSNLPNNPLVIPMDPFVLLFAISTFFTITIVLYSYSVDLNMFGIGISFIPLFIAELMYFIYMIYCDIRIGLFTRLAEKFRESWV